MKKATSKMDREAIYAEFAKYWDAKMAAYCTKKTETIAILPTGEIIPVEKQKIETRFCYGESGYDYDDALHAAAHARTSEDHFRRENMKDFESWISDLEAAKTMDRNHVLTICQKAYIGQSDDCRIAGIRFCRLTEILDACGGSAYLEELPGKALKVHGIGCRVATPEEIDLILAAYRQAAARHSKKVEAYLKRYGLSKVHAWTYWRDA